MTLNFINHHYKTKFKRELPPFEGKRRVFSKGLRFIVNIFAWTILLPSISIINQWHHITQLMGQSFLIEQHRHNFQLSFMISKHEKFIPFSISCALMSAIMKSMLVGRSALELRYIWLVPEPLLEFKNSTHRHQYLGVPIYNSPEVWLVSIPIQ